MLVDPSQFIYMPIAAYFVSPFFDAQFGNLATSLASFVGHAVFGNGSWRPRVVCRLKFIFFPLKQ